MKQNKTRQILTRVLSSPSWIEFITSVFYFEKIRTSVVIKVGILNWSAFQWTETKFMLLQFCVPGIWASLEEKKTKLCLMEGRDLTLKRFSLQYLILIL